MRPHILGLACALLGAACDPPDQGDTDTAPDTDVSGPRLPGGTRLDVTSGGSASDGVRRVVVHVGTPGPVGRAGDGRVTVTLGPAPPR